MPSTISRLKNTDSLGQWASKVNQLIDTVEGFLTTSGSITSGNTLNYVAAYSGSTWAGYSVAGDLTATISGSNLSFSLSATAFTGRSAVVGATGFSPSSDLILIYSGSAIKTITPSLLATPDCSTGYVQYNNGTTFAGATGFTFNAGTGQLAVPLSLIVGANNIYISSGKVGIGTASPSYTLDVQGGSINTSGTYYINGTAVISTTALGSTIISSSLTSVGTLTALSVSGAVVCNTSLTANTLSVTGAATFGSSVTVTGVLSGNQNIVAANTGNNTLSPNTVYVIGSTGVMTLPSTPTTGAFVGFRPASSSVNNYSVTGSTGIMNGSPTMNVDLGVPFDLVYTGSGWVLG